MTDSTRGFFTKLATYKLLLTLKLPHTNLGVEMGMKFLYKGA